MIFRDRVDAGRQLAKVLLPLKEKNPIILGLPRGGVPVAYEIAKSLNATLDVIIVRKLGVPWQPELAFGALGEDKEKFLNKTILNELNISPQAQAEIEGREWEEIRKRTLIFRNNRKPVNLRNRCVIIVDDGIATGATAQVACRVARHLGASEVIVAAPVAAKAALHNILVEANDCIVMEIPEDFLAVAEWYEDFSQVTDEDVVGIMKESQNRHGS